MKRLTIEAIHSQAARYAATNLIRADQISDPDMFVTVLRRWLRVHFVIVDEFEELLTSPILLIKSIASQGQAFGDCDDIAMLAASIMASIGIKVRFAALFPQEDGSFAHVIVQYRMNDMEPWQDFDATIPFTPQYPDNILTEEITT